MGLDPLNAVAARSVCQSRAINCTAIHPCQLPDSLSTASNQKKLAAVRRSKNAPAWRRHGHYYLEELLSPGRYKSALDERVGDLPSNENHIQRHGRLN
jgi:hypothetical protein